MQRKRYLLIADGERKEKTMKPMKYLFNLSVIILFLTL
jgi:hypothetical protein